MRKWLATIFSPRKRQAKSPELKLEAFMRENEAKSFAELRESILHAVDDVTDVKFVKEINLAELDFWKQSQVSQPPRL